MFNKKKSQPLLMCTVLHSLPGRVRIGCRALKYLLEYQSQIEKELSNISFVTSVKVSCITKNILIHYSDYALTQEEMVETVEEIIATYSLPAYKAEREEKNRLTVNERRIQEESVKTMVQRLVGTAGVIAYSYFKPSPVLLTGSILSRFTTLPALTSLFLSIPWFKSGVHSIKTSLRPNADALSAVATITSVAMGKDVSALTIILLSDIAELLTAYTMGKTRQAIKDMLSLGEEFAWKQLPDGGVERVEIEKIQKDDIVVVHTGEKICVDGQIIAGEAVIDQAAVTGEFMPVVRRANDQVFAGTVVKSGTITVKTEKAGDNTAIARIVHLVEDASHRKSVVQSYADRFSSQLIPLNFAFAGITYLATKNASRALSMLIIDYSCGVRLSTATAFSAAINTAVRNGVLIKGGNYIEALSEADTLILDKTGTLTEGKPQIVDIIAAKESFTKREILEVAAAAEETSNHPMAVAILSKVRHSGWSIPKHGEIQVHLGRGIETTIEQDKIRVGNKAFMNENGISTSPVKEQVHTLLLRGESLIYVAKNDILLGVLGIQDKLRENMKKTINRLRLQGIDDVILLTGDLEQQAEIVASRMAVDRFESELMPEDKAKSVLSLQSKGSKVIMVGDGINDAPALAYADVGIALGSRRTDIAMEAGDITIKGDNPMMLSGVLSLSQKTMQIVKQNFAMAIGINTMGLLLGAMGVLPVFWGAVLHNSSTIAVVGNSLRLLFYDIEKGR